MNGVSPIGNYGSGIPMQPAQYAPAANSAMPASGGVDGGLAAQGSGAVAGASITASQSAVAISQTSISASVESFMGTYGPVMANNEILGALLLLLTLQYMQSSDEQEKKGLLGLMLGLLQQQQQASQAGGSFMYSSSQLNIESTQMVAMSQQMAVDVYAGGGSIGSAPPVSGTGSGSVDTVA